MAIRLLVIAVLAPLALASVAFSPALAQAPVIGSGNDNSVSKTIGPVQHESVEGDFSVLFPSGCGDIHERVKDPQSGEEFKHIIQLTAGAYCERNGAEGEGCSVAAYIDTEPEIGRPANPAFVLDRVQEALQKYSAEILFQKPYRIEVPDGPLMVGVDVLASDADKKGQVWVRGLLVEGDVYVLIAWRAHGELAVDPEIVNFFESFIAHGG